MATLSGATGALSIWDAVSGNQLHSGREAVRRRGATRRPLAVLWGDRLAVGRQSGAVALWAVRRGALVMAGELRKHRGAVSSLVAMLGPAGARLLCSGSAFGGLRVWDMDARTCHALAPRHNGGIRALADLGRGRLLSADALDLSVWDLGSRTLLTHVQDANGGLSGGIHAAWAGFPGGGLAATFSRDTVQLWKLSEQTGAAGAGAAAAGTNQVEATLKKEGLPFRTQVSRNAGGVSCVSGAEIGGVLTLLYVQRDCRRTGALTWTADGGWAEKALAEGFGMIGLGNVLLVRR